MAPRHAKSQLFAIVVTVSLLVASTSARVWPTNGVCGARVRYSWTDLTSADKSLYHDALNQAMSTGFHALFTEVHSDVQSFKEAHNTCGMMYWHRRFLFAYEEMLRSLAPKFACITIPYWNYFADYANFLATPCNTFENCSNFLQDFGGSDGPTASLSINGYTVNGNCINGMNSAYSDYRTFCEKSTMSGSSCSGCIPRGSWNSTTFPSGICYSSLAQYLSLQYGFSWFSNNIHYGMHQTIHNTAMGAMATYVTAADPIFYSHHATVDLIQQLYFDCQIGRVLTDTEKQTGSYSFQSCAQTDYTYVSPTSTSTMTMFWTDRVTRTAVETHPRLKTFFAYQPKEFWRYVSATDMGNMSYTYQSDQVFSLLVSNGLSCPKSHTRKLEDANYVDVPITAANTTKAIGRSFNLFQDIRAAAVDNTTTETEALEQATTLDCLWYDDNYGVDDFNPAFRAAWSIPSTTHTMCYSRVQDIKYGRRRVKVANWRGRFDFHFNIMTDEQLATASDISTTEELAIISSSEASGASSTSTSAPTTTMSTPIATTSTPIATTSTPLATVSPDPATTEP